MNDSHKQDAHHTIKNEIYDFSYEYFVQDLRFRLAERPLKSFLLEEEKSARRGAKKAYRYFKSRLLKDSLFYNKEKGSFSSWWQKEKYKSHYKAHTHYANLYNKIKPYKKSGVSYWQIQSIPLERFYDKNPSFSQTLLGSFDVLWVRKTEKGHPLGVYPALERFFNALPPENPPQFLFMSFCLPQDLMFPYGKSLFERSVFQKRRLLLEEYPQKDLGFVSVRGQKFQFSYLTTKPQKQP